MTSHQKQTVKRAVAEVAEGRPTFQKPDDFYPENGLCCIDVVAGKTELRFRFYNPSSPDQPAPVGWCFVTK